MSMENWTPLGRSRRSRYDVEVGRERRRRTSPIPAPAAANAATSAINHEKSENPLTLGVGVAVGAPWSDTGGPGAGSCSRLRPVVAGRAMAAVGGGAAADPGAPDGVAPPAPLTAPLSCATILVGSDEASERVPGPGACGPPADGTSSQYWFAALTVELVQGAPGVEPGGGWASASSGADMQAIPSTTTTTRCLRATVKEQQRS
jgi:hypothetical protein